MTIDASAMDQMLQKTGGRKAIPTIEVDGELVMVGGDFKPSVFAGKL